MDASDVRLIVFESGKNQTKEEESCEGTEMVNRDQYKYRFDFGFRQMGDVLMDRKVDEHSWDATKNVDMKLRCVATDGHTISHVDIQVDQSSTGQPSVDIVAGGIGTNSLEIAISGKDTNWLRYNAKFYGRVGK